MTEPRSSVWAAIALNVFSHVILYYFLKNCFHFIFALLVTESRAMFVLLMFLFMYNHKLASTVNLIQPHM